jgi:hypothetical protein
MVRYRWFAAPRQAIVAGREENEQVRDHHGDGEEIEGRHDSIVVGKDAAGARALVGAFR